MRHFKTILFSLVLTLALMGFDAVARNSVDDWKVGAKVVGYDDGWFRGTIAEVGDKIPFLRDAYIKIRTESGEILELKDPFRSLWSAEYACDSRGLCVDQTAMVSTDQGYGDVLRVKIVSVGEEGSVNTGVVGEVVGDQQGQYNSGRIKYKSGELEWGYSINFLEGGGCNSKNVCAGDDVVFKGMYSALRGKVIGLVGGTSCPGKGRFADGGYVIESDGGSLVLETECGEDLVAKIYPHGACDTESGLCRDQQVYYWVGAGYVDLGRILATTRTHAYIQRDYPARGTVIEKIDHLGFSEGCLEGYSVCVGDKVLTEEDSSYLEVLGRYKNLSALVLRTPNGRALSYSAEKVYILSGCAGAGFCVGDSVQVDISGHKAKVVGINGELLAIKFLTGERVGQIGFGWRSSDLRK